MTNIYVVDAPCGAGKTSSAINMINQSNNEKYLFITPFLKEVERIKSSCREKQFFEPQEKGTKLNGIHWLIGSEKNIASTHALFLNFNEDTLNLLKQKEYILILDEVADVVEIMDISKKDLETILEKYAHIEDGLLIWDDMDYTGVFFNIMRMSLNKCIGIYGDTALIWCFPIEIFKIFKEVYILTYMFNGQVQKYYYNFYSTKYNYKYIKYVNNIYSFTDIPQTYENIYKKYKDLIKICKDEKLNSVGDNETALSVSWFIRNNFNTGKHLLKILKNNVGNYFKHIIKTTSKENMWTTFKKFKNIIRGDGYSKGFVSVNARATNNYRHKRTLAYCVNIFMNPVLKQFFQQKNIEVDEDKYALSEMIQWIWRSAIRDNKPINIYIPSSRMRNLLIDWLNKLPK